MAKEIFLATTEDSAELRVDSFLFRYANDKGEWGFMAEVNGDRLSLPYGDNPIDRLDKTDTTRCLLAGIGWVLKQYDLVERVAMTYGEIATRLIDISADDYMSPALLEAFDGIAESRDLNRVHLLELFMIAHWNGWRDAMNQGSGYLSYRADEAIQHFNHAKGNLTRGEEKP